jgi:hypothetical protein
MLVLKASAAIVELTFTLTTTKQPRIHADTAQKPNRNQLDTLKQTFAQNYHPRLAKEFFRDEPYGTHREYREKIQTANLDKLAKLITVTALLLQTKIYLFWQNPTTPQKPNR